MVVLSIYDFPVLFIRVDHGLRKAGSGKALAVWEHIPRHSCAQVHHVSRYNLKIVTELLWI